LETLNLLIIKLFPNVCEQGPIWGWMTKS